MESSKSNGWIRVGTGFVAGVAFGGLALPELRGYSSRAECLTKEVQSNSTDYDAMAALGYCNGLFPNQAPREPAPNPAEAAPDPSLMDKGP